MLFPLGKETFAAQIINNFLAIFDVNKRVWDTGELPGILHEENIVSFIFSIEDRFH